MQRAAELRNHFDFRYIQMYTISSLKRCTVAFQKDSFCGGLLVLK